MPLIDFTDPFYLLSAIILIILCIILGRNVKTNTSTGIAVLAFLTILTCHAVEIGLAEEEAVLGTLGRNIMIDEILLFVTFLSFLWMDRIQINHKEEVAKAKKSKDTKENISDKVIKDGLDFLWKKV